LADIHACLHAGSDILLGSSIKQAAIWSLSLDIISKSCYKIYSISGKKPRISPISIFLYKMLFYREFFKQQLLGGKFCGYIFTLYIFVTLQWSNEINPLDNVVT